MRIVEGERAALERDGEQQKRKHDALDLQITDFQSKLEVHCSRKKQLKIREQKLEAKLKEQGIQLEQIDQENEHGPLIATEDILSDDENKGSLSF